jgi:hypothetical protein
MPSCFLQQMKGIFDHRMTGMATYPLDEILLASRLAGCAGHSPGALLAARPRNPN